MGEQLRTPIAGESLRDWHPEVAAEWHPTRNGQTGPDAVSHASGFRAWWLCRKPGGGHEWRTAVANRTTGKRSGCPVCSRVAKYQPAPGKSFADLYPELLTEWHPTSNVDLDPRRIKPGSSASAWWLCSVCGHEWAAIVAARATAGTGCRLCSHKMRGNLRRTPPAQNSLVEVYPQVVAEWDWEANEGVDPATLRPGTDLNVWWRCARRGHRWQARVSARTGKATRCPRCVHLPEPGESFADLNPERALEWHPIRNGDRRLEEFKPASGFKAWWKCLARGHEWQASIAKRNGPRASSCPTCTMWGTSAAQIRIAYELIAVGVPVVLNHPKIPVTGRRPVAADIVVPGMKVIIEYDGSYHHAVADAFERDCLQTALLTAASWTVVRIRPEPLVPIDSQSVRVAANATIKQIASAVVRKLSLLGHTPSNLDGYLADDELWAGGEADRAVLHFKSRSLLYEFPRIAAEWHPTRNGSRTPRDVNPGSKLPVWWQCAECGHEWRVRPGHRTKAGGTGCPQCAASRRARQNRTPKPGKSMAEIHPHLLKIFHPTRNGDLDLRALNGGTTHEIWWLCPDCGHQWRTGTARRSGCRPCASKRQGQKAARPRAGQSLADLHPAIAEQWHPTKNKNLLSSHVREGCATPVWWLCADCGHEWRRSPGARVANRSGCRCCAAGKAGAARMMPAHGESLADTHPHLAGEWIPEKNPGLSPTSVKANRFERAWWRCSRCGHAWNARVDTRALLGYGCMKCALTRLSITNRRPLPGRSLIEVKPELLPLWHATRNTDIKPRDLNPNSHTRVWWQCPACGYEWQAAPRQTGCRPCGMKRVKQQTDHASSGPLSLRAQGSSA
ncbi:MULTISPECIES: zinc-ribbon domain-containing protein [Mycobacterium]|uniref:zinc-ribbon domain-containing protein n=1 Tax=Mycobacterium TaxID=1763 RepID=UPI00351CCE7C